MSALTIACQKLESLIKKLLTPHDRNFICDSKSPKLCFACEIFRAKFTGRDKPLLKWNRVVFTRRGNYVVQSKQFSHLTVKTKGLQVVVTNNGEIS